MKKKAIISFIMVFTMSTGLFMGCGSNKTSQDNQDNKKVETSVTKDSSKESDSKQKEDIKDDKKAKEDSTKLQENNDKENKQSNNDNKNENKKSVESKQKSDKIVNNSDFTPQKAIEIAKKKYGTANGDIVYSYQEEPHFVNGKKGYYIKLSSRKMIKQGGSGTLTLLLVTSDGKIVEDPR